MFRNLICLIFFVFICVAKLAAQDLNDTPAVKPIVDAHTPDAVITQDEIVGFKKQAIASVTELGNYIKIVADKTRELGARNNSIELAVKLFATEEKIVQVSSAKSTAIKPLKIRTYLAKLKAIPYSKVAITWYDIYLSSEFKLGPDGKYYGTATIFQKFEGTTNKEKGSYKDITKKSIQIIVEKVQYIEGLDKKERWVLKLGDINVEETK